MTAPTSCSVSSRLAAAMRSSSMPSSASCSRLGGGHRQRRMLDALGHKALGVEAQDDEQRHRYQQLAQRRALDSRQARDQWNDEARRLQKENDQHGAQHRSLRVAGAARKL